MGRKAGWDRTARRRSRGEVLRRGNAWALQLSPGNERWERGHTMPEADGTQVLHPLGVLGGCGGEAGLRHRGPSWFMHADEWIGHVHHEPSEHTLLSRPRSWLGIAWLAPCLAPSASAPSWNNPLPRQLRPRSFISPPQPLPPRPRGTLPTP